MFDTKIALFGGSFDPIHAGHIAVADKVLLSCKDIAAVWFLPCYCDGFGEKKLSSPEHRINMLNLALHKHGNKRILICTHEIDTKSTDGTYAMLKKLRCKFKQFDFAFVMGTDQAKRIRQWRNSRKLLEEENFIVAKRTNSFMPRWVTSNTKHKTIIVPEVPWIEKYTPVSSTAIRKICEKDANKLNESLVIAPEVLDYIKENNLYRKD